MSKHPQIVADRKRAGNLRVAGLAVFFLGAVLATVGTPSIALFISSFVLIFAGAGLIALGESQYRKTLG
jgi:hypothetical protein